MSSFRGVSAGARSIRRLLEMRFREEEPVTGSATSVAILRTEDLDPTNMASQLSRPLLGVFLYRVDINKTMRAAWSGVGLGDGRSHLALDLHFLLTAWADNAENEFLILGRAMQVIEDTPILAGPLLTQAAEWAPHDTMQLVHEDVDTDALMRIFDSLPLDYRLSVPYLARVMRIDGRVPPATQRDPDVVTATLGARPTV